MEIVPRKTCRQEKNYFLKGFKFSLLSNGVIPWWCVEDSRGCCALSKPYFKTTNDARNKTSIWT